jgi:hypothetical protein
MGRAVTPGRDHGRVTVLFGREYGWRDNAGRLTLEPFWWPPTNRRRRVRLGFRPGYTA